MKSEGSAPQHNNYLTKSRIHIQYCCIMRFRLLCIDVTRFYVTLHQTYYDLHAQQQPLSKVGRYTPTEVDKLFTLIMTKFMHAPPIYGANQCDLNATQHFLTRCYERRYTIDHVNIFNLLEKCDRRLFLKIKG